jgi:hypothetical protein
MANWDPEDKPVAPLISKLAILKRTESPIRASTGPALAGRTSGCSCPEVLGLPPSGWGRSPSEAKPCAESQRLSVHRAAQPAAHQALKHNSNLSLQRARRDKVCATECGKKVVKHIFVGQVRSRQP